MASLGDLVVNLKARTGPFQKGMKRSESTLMRFRAAAKAALIGGVVAGAAAAVAAVSSLTRQMSELDKVAKLATRTGFDPATIAGFGFAAEQSGSSAAAASTSLDQFVRRLGDAADGSGAAATTLAGMGISTSKLLALKPGQQLEAVADAIAQLPTKAQQADAAYQLFGRSGMELVNVLALGSQGIRDFQAEADKLGLGFSAEELATVEAANDAMNRLHRRVGALWSAFVVELAPSIEKLLNLLNKLEITGSQVAWVFKQWAKTIIPGAQAMLLMAQMIGLLDSEAGATSESMKKLNKEMNQSDLAADIGIESGAKTEVDSSGADKSILSAKRDLAVLRGELTELNRQGMDFRDSGATHEQVNEMTKLQIEKQKILDRQEAIKTAEKETADIAAKAAKAAEERQQIAERHRKTITDTQKDLKIQLGMMTEIDAQVAEQKEAGMGTKRLKLFRGMLEGQENLEGIKGQIGQPVKGGVLAEQGSEKALKIILGAGKDQKLLKEAAKQTAALKTLVKQGHKTPESSPTVQGAVA